MCVSITEYTDPTGLPFVELVLTDDHGNVSTEYVDGDAYDPAILSHRLSDRLSDLNVDYVEYADPVC